MPNMETHKLAQIMKFPTFEKEHSPTNSVEMTSALPVKESCLVKRRKQAKVCKVTHSHRQKYLLSFGGVRFHRFSQLFTAVSCLILKKGRWFNFSVALAKSCCVSCCKRMLTATVHKVHLGRAKDAKPSGNKRQKREDRAQGTARMSC